MKTLAMQGLADLTRQDAALLPEVLDLIRILARSGTPAHTCAWANSVAPT